MINELSREDLTSDEIGGLTDRGKAAAALHAANYAIYTQQAADYKNELLKINTELAKDPANKTLLDRKQELTQAAQTAAQAAQDEKYANIELSSQGYEALSNKLGNLINDYNQLLDAEKNAYDYQNTISDKTTEISRIRKQLEAYSGDISEETRAKVQSLKLSLEEAEKDLKETQYDKYISDTKDMLSDLQEDFDASIQSLIDSLSGNFDTLLTEIDAASAETCQTIQEAMTGIGYMPTEDFQALLNGSALSSSASGMLTEIRNLHTTMTQLADKMASGFNEALKPQEQSNSGTARSYQRTLTEIQLDDKHKLWQEADSSTLLGKASGTLPKISEEAFPKFRAALYETPRHTAASSLERSLKSGDVKIEMGGISMYGVNDPEAFAANLKHALNNNTKIKHTLLNNTVGTLAKGYNSLSGRRF